LEGIKLIIGLGGGGKEGTPQFSQKDFLKWVIPYLPLKGVGGVKTFTLWGIKGLSWGGLIKVRG